MCTHYFAYTHLLYTHSSNLSGIERGFPKIQISIKTRNTKSHTIVIRSHLIYTDMFKLIVGFNILSLRHKFDGCQAIKTSTISQVNFHMAGSKQR